MIRVRMGQDPEKRIVALRIKGHAGFAERGKDLVCASASILAHTAAQDVKDHEKAGRLACAPTVRLSEGRTEIAAQAATDEAFALLLHTFFVIQKGFLLLEHNHPRCVSVRKADS